MIDVQLMDTDLDALIGVLAAVDGLALAGILDEHSLEVIARRLRLSEQPREDETIVEYVHRRLDELNIRLRQLSGEPQN